MRYHIRYPKSNCIRTEKINRPNLKESFKKVGGFKYTDYVGDVVRAIENNSFCRILYDRILDIYFVDPSANYIHMDMSREAYKQGMYAHFEPFIDYLGS